MTSMKRSWDRKGLCSHRGCAPHSLFGLAQKENAPRPVEKKKCSAGRSAQAQTSCRRRGKVGSPLRRSGAETRRPWGNLQPGAVRDTLSDSPRCRSRFFEEQPAAAKREAAQCVLAPRRPPHHPPRDGSCKLTEGDSVPEGQAKSEQAPIRRPPCARRATAPERARRPFLLDRARPVFFSAKTEKKMGGASPLDKPPLREQNPRGRRSAAPPRLCSSPTTALIRQVHI